MIIVQRTSPVTGKDKIAFCGYHGWQDWYLAANIEDKKNLNNHLLKDLDPIGVPKELKPEIFKKFFRRRHRSDIIQV